MTTAEKLAMEAYPPKIEFAGEPGLEFDINELNRIIFADAFNRAKEEILKSLKMEEGLFNRHNIDPDNERMDGVCHGLHRAVLLVEDI